MSARNAQSVDYLTGMTQRHAILMLLLSLVPIACDRSSNPAVPAKTVPNNDQLIVALVLQDFVNWKAATFGELEGILELDANSQRLPDMNRARVGRVATGIADHISDELIDAYLARNQTSVSIKALIAGSQRWARVRGPRAEGVHDWMLPDGVKATGSLALPGYSADGQRALLQIHHSWSMHSADVTYVLGKQNGRWVILARDQAVFL